jgi:ABC-2 type transport system ATP-binding protein
MDEAERCHRLAFIFRGQLMKIGAPGQIVAERALSVAELVVDDVAKATAALTASEATDECAHYGHVLRLATRGGVDAVAHAREVLAAHHIEIASIQSARASVEDAFVSMVREDML